ncbi:proline reductase-associated electron transfer protein PrdC [Caminicella sporogenes DSM 14501]|uniref:Proline reductase-associated electron transfer protein PrdC n=2 Tax=Caminicella TaxID=166484 RepID=A0A1M6RRK6_9FIRM|nr:proline reductase-associated electron transfer protein PrdC [Caminicella sporogenes]SHK35083.1 proline reductase-associated electron transfer protein PrdC [Caminicella sporogenes DSM 14501]
MRIVLPLKQHVGNLCKPIVKVGEEVKKGQLVALPDGLGANIHSSVYGKVVEIKDDSIVIEAFENQPEEYVKIKETDNYLEAIKEAGIVGAGGAGFPTHIKLKADLKGGYIIVNSAECEPILNHNIRFVEENPETILRGIKYVMEITNASKGYIAIKPKHKKAIISMGKVCKEEENIEVKFLPDMYPAGDERVIIRELLGVELQPGQLPIEANAVVLNVETIKNIVLAIEERRPVITKDLTVGGRVKDRPEGKVFLDVPLGMPVKYFIDKCGGYVEPYGEIVLGGPFTGKHGEEDSPVTKTTGGVLVSLPFPKETRKVGVIACECGAQEARLEEIAKGMGAEIVASTKCKRMVEVNGRYRCDKPGVCPGQAEKVLYLKKHGAQVIITGTCED